jgi:DNA-directed RNA polymerase subunit RPC12/RpoP
MAADNNERPLPTHVDVVCPTCRARLHPRLQRTSYFVKCPDCFVQVVVPPRDEIVRQLEEAARLKRREEVGTYGLGSVEQPTESVRSITVVCKKCGARLDPVLKAEARRIRCPDCHSAVAVPSAAEIERARERQKKPRPQSELVPYQMGPAPAPPRLPSSTYYVDKAAEIRREPAPSPPRWTFFSGVFSFPWLSGALWRWICMSAGWTGTLAFCALLTGMFGMLGATFGVAVIFFGMPTIWCALLTLAYSAACFLPVVTDTAAGNARVEAWPDPVWKEWAAQLMYVSFLGFASIVVGYGVGRLAGTFTTWDGWAGLSATFLIFPVILLSSLEANSAFVPLTTPILRSLVTGWWAWLLFYLLSGVLWWLFLMAVLAILVSFLPAIIAMGPVLAALLLIYARLIGRLGWRISWSEVHESDDQTATVPA